MGPFFITCLYMRPGWTTFLERMQLQPQVYLISLVLMSKPFTKLNIFFHFCIVLFTLRMKYVYAHLFEFVSKALLHFHVVHASLYLIKLSCNLCMVIMINNLRSYEFDQCMSSILTFRFHNILRIFSNMSKELFIFTKFVMTFVEMHLILPIMSILNWKVSSILCIRNSR